MVCFFTFLRGSLFEAGLTPHLMMAGSAMKMEPKAFEWVCSELATIAIGRYFLVSGLHYLGQGKSLRERGARARLRHNQGMDFPEEALYFEGAPSEEGMAWKCHRHTNQSWIRGRTGVAIALFSPTRPLCAINVL